MDLIKTAFVSKAVTYKGAIIMYCPQDAIDVVNYCKEMGKKLYGLDAFKLIANGGIQPFLEFSTDYSYDYSDSVYAQAVEHIEKNSDKDFVFEIVYEGY